MPNLCPNAWLPSQQSCSQCRRLAEKCDAWIGSIETSEIPEFHYIAMYNGEYLSTNGLRVPTSLHFSHIHHTSDAIPRLHILKRSIDLIQRLPVRDELIHLQLAGHVVVHQVRELRAAFDATKGTSFPYTPSDELECWEQVRAGQEPREAWYLRRVLISWPAAATPMTILCPQPL